jgi:hypothetical protein
MENKVGRNGYQEEVEVEAGETAFFFWGALDFFAIAASQLLTLQLEELSLYDGLTSPFFFYSILLISYDFF